MKNYAQSIIGGNMDSVLVVVDMQNDFIDGALGSEYAKNTVLPNVIKKVREAHEKGSKIIFTADTHYDYSYKDLVEGVLPEHCIIGSKGWDVADALQYAVESYPIVKPSFGYIHWKDYLERVIDNDTVIEVIGLCTDICVISNALILRSSFPNNKIIVDSSCCGGTSKEAHDAALTVMKSCFIEVV